MMPGTPAAANWRGADLAREPDRFTRRWTDAEIEHLVELASAVDPLDPEFGAAPPENLGGPASALAQRIRGDLIDGLGFAIVRGFPLSDLGYERSAVAFAVFGSLVGSLRPQNAAGHRLGHVIDVGADASDPTVRYYQTNQRQTFHTDGADGVGLFCVRTAPQGGESLLVSVEAVVEKLERRRTGSSARLFEPVATDRRGEEAPGELPFFSIPVLTRAGGRLTVCYQRQYIESARRFADAPELDDEYGAALDLFDEVMNDPSIHLRVGFEPGDMQFVHNHSLLHDRTAFVDHPDPDRRRHLLRVWLSLPGDRALDPAFAERYGTIEAGNRGGVRAGEGSPSFPLHAS